MVAPDKRRTENEAGRGSEDALRPAAFRAAGGQGGRRRASGISAAEKLLGAMEKDDAAYTGIINRYCQIYAECLSLSERRERFELGIEELREGYGRGEIEAGQYYKLLRDMQKNINAVDKIADSKRQMLLAIEKECCLTVAAALRAVPKKPSEKENTDPMASLLGRRA